MVLSVVAGPTHVLASTISPDRIIMLNQSVVSARAAPLCVIVDRATGVICTAYYNRTLRVILPGQILWSQPKNE